MRRLYFWNIYGWIKTDEGLIRYGGDPDEIFASVHIFEVVPETGVPYGWTDSDRYWVELTPAAAGTADFDKSIFVIPVTAQAPMGALRVLDLLYSSDSAETLADLLFTGGSTNGEPDRSNYQNAVFSSSLFLPETAADLPGWRQSLAEQTRTRALGRYLGFHPDTSADRELMNRLRRAALECIPPMTWGQIEYSKSNRSLLNIAGLEKYIDYYLQQLNDWLDQ